MQKIHQVTSNAFYFGLTCDGVEVLPCINNKLWRITESLVGFRRGSLFGIYSLIEERVVHEPVLRAEIPYFKLIQLDRENKLREPRYTCEHGCFVKRRAYLETYDYLLWRKNRLYVMGPGGVVVILKNGQVRPYNGKSQELAAYRVSQQCLFQGEYGNAEKAQLKDFHFMTRADEAIDEQNFLNSFDDKLPDFSGPEEDTTDDEPEDNSEPVYRQYDYDAIPALIKEKLRAHFEARFDPGQFTWLPRVLTYLAWCHANDLVEYDEWGNCTIDPMYAMDPEDARHVFDIAMLYEAHHMEEVQHLLYLSPVTNSYFDVLVFEN